MTDVVAGSARTLEDPLAESLRIIDATERHGLLVRLMGGMAIRAHAPDWTARTRRIEVDMDFATRSRDRMAFYYRRSQGVDLDAIHAEIPAD
jgi:hypothetical protein